MGRKVCNSQTQPLPRHVGQGLVRSCMSFALGAGGFFIMTES